MWRSPEVRQRLTAVAFGERRDLYRKCPKWIRAGGGRGVTSQPEVAVGVFFAVLFVKVFRHVSE